MTLLTVDFGGRQQDFATAEFPLSLGGPHTHIRLSELGAGAPVAYLGLDHDDLFIQPGAESPGTPVVTCNGVALTASRWLEDGDVVAVGAARIRFTAEPGRFRLTIEESRAGTLRHTDVDGDFQGRPHGETVLIRPVSFSPRRPARTTRRRFRPTLGASVAAALVLVLATCAWYVLTAHSVVIHTEPPADQLALVGGLTPGWNGHYLLRPGTYGLRAEKTNYLPIDAVVEVGRNEPPIRRFVFEPLGGSITITTRPINGAAVTVDGIAVGTTPIDGLTLGAGDHRVEIAAPLHLAYSTTLTVEPGSPALKLDVDLVPNWAPVTISSSPTGAEIRIDGTVVGETPATIDLEAGTRELEIRHKGRQSAIRTLEVVAGEALDAGVITLEPEEGRLAVTSVPPGATVTIASRYRGTTPVEASVPPDTPLEVRVSLAGYSTFAATLTAAPGEVREIRANLEIQTGEVVITSQPPDAVLVIDGAPRGRTGQTVELDARQHEIEVRLEGYLPYRTVIVPEAGITQAVRASLRPAGAAGLPETISSPQGAELVLIGPGRFTMGAPRREPGRRANEVLREVEITKSFYLSAREVTNREFREFKSGHLSGSFHDYNLEIDHHPVVNVSWEDAARYCNWLSAKAGLPPVYVERNGTLVPRSPMTVGFRLPTEAEWAWAARFAGSGSPTKYGWGDALPVPNGAGNYGDASGQAFLRGAIPDYSDGYPVTAPAGSFSPNSLGLYNLGGNVAEWVQDVYTSAPGTPGAIEQDPLGPSSGSQHVVRGASWMDTVVTELRLTCREGGDAPRPDLGFRIARSAQ